MNDNSKYDPSQMAAGRKENTGSGLHNKGNARTHDVAASYIHKTGGSTSNVSKVLVCYRDNGNTDLHKTVRITIPPNWKNNAPTIQDLLEQFVKPYNAYFRKKNIVSCKNKASILLNVSDVHICKLVTSSSNHKNESGKKIAEEKDDERYIRIPSDGLLSDWIANHPILYIRHNRHIVDSHDPNLNGTEYAENVEVVEEKDTTIEANSVDTNEGGRKDTIESENERKNPEMVPTEKGSNVDSESSEKSSTSDVDRNPKVEPSSSSSSSSLFSSTDDTPTEEHNPEAFENTATLSLPEEVRSSSADDDDDDDDDDRDCSKTKEEKRHYEDNDDDDDDDEVDDDTVGQLSSIFEKKHGTNSRIGNVLKKNRSNGTKQGPSRPCDSSSAASSFFSERSNNKYVKSLFSRLKKTKKVDDVGSNNSFTNDSVPNANLANLNTIADKKKFIQKMNIIEKLTSMSKTMPPVTNQQQPGIATDSPDSTGISRNTSTTSTIDPTIPLYLNQKHASIRKHVSFGANSGSGSVSTCERSHDDEIVFEDAEGTLLGQELMIKPIPPGTEDDHKTDDSSQNKSTGSNKDDEYKDMHEYIQKLLSVVSVGMDDDVKQVSVGGKEAIACNDDVRNRKILSEYNATPNDEIELIYIRSALVSLGLLDDVSMFDAVMKLMANKFNGRSVDVFNLNSNEQRAKVVKEEMVSLLRLGITSALVQCHQQQESLINTEEVQGAGTRTSLKGLGNMMMNKKKNYMPSPTTQVKVNHHYVRSNSSSESEQEPIAVSTTVTAGSTTTQSIVRNPLSGGTVFTAASPNRKTVAFQLTEDTEKKRKNMVTSPVANQGSGFNYLFCSTE